MKKWICLCCILCLLGFVGCDRYGDPMPAASDPTNAPAVTTEADTAPTEPETTADTTPLHTQLYLPEVSQEDMVTYFTEAVLDMEYNYGEGNANLVKKWNARIYYQISGAPTQRDLALLQELFDGLNQIPGFPGICEAAEPVAANLTINFLDKAAFDLAFSDFLQGETADGAAQFWYYNSNNEIHTGQIGYRTDISQELRDSVILEEIVNLLGINDTVLREDSIVYQYSSDVTALSAVDWTLLKLLYDPQIQSGMDAEGCLRILEQLYH